jgi:hypothetical protein
MINIDKFKQFSFYSDIEYLECGNGWEKLLYKLSEDIQKEIKKYGDDDWIKEFRVLQVKEKYGTLNFYVSHMDDNIATLIDKAENKSSKVCEICGKHGKKRMRNNWFMARCDKCYDEGK